MNVNNQIKINLKKMNNSYLDNQWNNKLRAINHKINYDIYQFLDHIDLIKISILKNYKYKIFKKLV